MNALPLIDRAVLDDLSDSIGADGTRSVLEAFIGESETYLVAIAAAARQPDDPACRDGARRAAHSFKSGAGQIGAAAAAAAAAAVEGAATAAPSQLPHAAAELAQYAAATIAALKDLLNGPAAR